MSNCLSLLARHSKVDHLKISHRNPKRKKTCRQCNGHPETLGTHMRACSGASVSVHCTNGRTDATAVRGRPPDGTKCEFKSCACRAVVLVQGNEIRGIATGWYRRQSRSLVPYFGMHALDIPRAHLGAIYTEMLNRICTKIFCQIFVHISFVNLHADSNSNFRLRFSRMYTRSFSNILIPTQCQ